MPQQINRFVFVLFWIILFTAARPFSADAEIDLGLFNIQVIVPGMTKSIDIRQQRLFPFGCPSYLILVLGRGTLGLSVKKDDVEGDLIFMAGMTYSAAGNVPIYRIGMSNGMIDQIIEIGTKEEPYGLIWIYCGIALSQNVPQYNCELRLSLTN